MSDYTPTTQQVRDGYRFDPEEDYYNPLQAGANTERAGRDFDRWLKQVKAEAWEEGYRQGIEDERTAEAVQVNIGLGGHATPNRANPYRKETQA